MDTRLALILLSLFGSILTSPAQITFEALNSTVTQELKSVSFENEQLGYVCGNEGTVLKTVDGGSTWTVLSPGVSVNLWDVRVIPGTNGEGVMAVGDQKKIIRSMDGGDTWSQITSPLGSSTFLFGVTPVSVSEYWIAGGDFSCSPGAVIANTVNGGDNWSTVCAPSCNFAEEVVSPGNSVLYTCGFGASGQTGSILKSDDNGVTWNLLETTTSLMNSLWAIDDQKVFVVGNSGVTRVTLDGGVTWSNSSLPGGDVFYSAIRFSDSMTGFACGTGPGGVGVVYMTTDGGDQWDEIPFSEEGAWDIARVNSVAYVVGINGSISKSINIPTGIGSEFIDDTPIQVDLLNGRGQYRVSSSAGLVESIEIYDTQGRMVHSEKGASNSLILDLGSLKSGVYHLAIKAKNYQIPIVVKLYI